MAVDRGMLERLGGEELLVALLERTADAVYAVDGSGRVVLANPAAAGMLGYEGEEELLGRGEEDWFVRRDGSSAPVAYSATPVTVDGERGALVVFREESAPTESAAAGTSAVRLVEATYAERRRFSRHLHDGPQQRLINVVMSLQLAARSAADEHSRELINKSVTTTKRAIDELRDIAALLYPAVLTNRGLPSAIAWIAARAPVPATVEVTELRAAPVVEATTYLAVTEALGNVANHAEATQVSIKVAADDARLRLVIADDGRGGAAPDRERGSALATLEDRVAALGGTLTIDSPPGEGTRVTAELPLHPDGR